MCLIEYKTVKNIYFKIVYIINGTYWTLSNTNQVFYYFLKTYNTTAVVKYFNKQNTGFKILTFVYNLVIFDRYNSRLISNSS